MKRPDAGGRESLLNQIGSTYLTARWFLGGGLIALTAIVLLAGLASIEVWVVAAAGVTILAHAFAMRAWEVRETNVAMAVDVTTASLAAMVLAGTGGDPTPALLTFVGATVLIALFSQRWARLLVFTYAAGLTLVSLLMTHDGDLSLALGDFLGSLFVATLIIGVVSGIRTRLFELEASKAQTMGVVSHELRNHLAGVVGAIQLIRDGSLLSSDEADELMQMAHEQSMEAGEVIEDLLTASRVESGALDSLPELVDVRPLTETTIRRTAIDEEILYDLSGGPVWALADPLRYKQIIRNLLTNALRYGGDTIRVSVETDGDAVSVVVADDGDGIDPADEAGMFRPYHRHRGVEQVPDSTGLGLWISRSLARRMGGELTYRRQSGQTVFELTIPAGPDPSPQTGDHDATTNEAAVSSIG